MSGRNVGWHEKRQAVDRSVFQLGEVAQRADSRLVEMEQALDAQRKQVDEQKKIVAKIGQMRRDYQHDADKWTRSASSDLHPTTREWMVEYAHQRALSVKVALPWKRPSDPRYPKRVRRVVHDSDSSESDEAPLSARPRKTAPAPAPTPVAGPAEEEEEDVVEMGERSWAQRDAALRQQAIPLDSCVDQVFRELGLDPDEPAVPVPTDALFGSDRNKFQPTNMTFNHTKRTTFDAGANVRARVRFRMEGKYPVAWLDDLHSLHYNMRGKGDQQGLWQLPGGAPYATSRSMHEYVGGVKIWRVENDTFRIKFYGPRSRLPGFLGGEPEVYAVYAEVPVASADRWDPKTWTLLGPARHHITFRSHVKQLFPMIMATLLNASVELLGTTKEDARVRAWWAKKPIVVYAS